MPYLVCEKCGGYYELQEGETSEDFSSICECCGRLRMVESLDEIQDSKINDQFKGDMGENLSQNTSKSYKKFLSQNFFKISIILGVICIIIVSTSVLTYKNGSYGIFYSNENEKYTPEQIDTFLESAFSPDDYGNTYDKVGKWNINVVRIKVIGSPTEEDIKTLTKAINDINTNVKSFQLVIDDFNQFEPDMEIYFIPHSEFTRYSVNPSKVDGFTMWLVSTSSIYGGNSAGEIFKARVFIGTDQRSQKRRSHVIVHELAHSLGLHHNQNQNSVLYKNGPDITEYSDLDKTMMRILYRNDISPFMSRTQVEIILNNSKRSFF